MTPYGTDELNVTVSTIGSDQSNSVGTAGGYPGAGANAFVSRETDVWDRLAHGPVPVDLRDLRGQFEALPAKHAFQLRPGDVFATQPHGGGGFGDPLERDPEAVVRDVVHGFVTPEWADRVYGVVLQDGERVDRDATRRRREGQREGRMARAVRREPPETLDVRGAPGDGAAQRLGETLRVVGDTVLCARCAAPLCHRAVNPKEWCCVVEEELGAANPRIAVRWGGRSERFRLLIYLCPACGATLDLHERRREERGHWHDLRLS
jgi:N-methylhydantoinase B